MIELLTKTLRSLAFVVAASRFSLAAPSVTLVKRRIPP